MTQGRARSRSVGYGTGHLHLEDPARDDRHAHSAGRTRRGRTGHRPAGQQIVRANRRPIVGRATGHTGVWRASRRARADDGPMPDLTRFSVLFGGLLLMGVIVLALRWTWGTGPSIPTAQLPDPDDPTGSGLLVEASQVPNPAAAEVLRGRLTAAGIRATVRRD